MFVASNKISDVRIYFKNALKGLYTDSEMKLMFELIALTYFQLTKTELILGNDKRLSESELLTMRQVVNRLLKNEPFQYVLGETEFFGLTIKCNDHALIPRPETEELVEWVREQYVGNKGDLRMMDLCTGTGCIALALKSLFPKAKLSAVDVSEEALALAIENSNLLQLEIDFRMVDLLLANDLPYPLSSFDCWVSNPPYIPVKDKGKMQDNVLDFEPHLALFVENHQALVFYEKITFLAKRYLNEDGYLFFEIHEELASEVKAILEQNKFSQIEIRNDLQGKNRMIRGRK